VAGRHLLCLAQDTFARAHVVVEDLRWSRWRRIIKAQPGRIPEIAVRDAERIRGFLEIDRMLCAGCAFAHDDARQAVLAFHAHDKVCERVHIEDQDAGAMRNLDAPVFFRRIVVRRRDQREIDCAVAVGADPETIVEVDDGIVDAPVRALRSTSARGHRRLCGDSATRWSCGRSP